MSNDQSFINDIINNKYPHLKCAINKVGKAYDNYIKEKKWENYLPIINGLKILGCNKYESYKYRNEYAKKCSEIYNKYLLSENETKEIDYNDYKKDKSEVKLIDQIINNKDFVYEVIENEYTDVEHKLRRIIVMNDTSFEDYGFHGNWKQDAEMARILLDFGYDEITYCNEDKYEVPREEKYYVNPCIKFYNKLLAVKKKNRIEYSNFRNEQILRDISIDYEYARHSCALSNMMLVMYDIKRLGYEYSDERFEKCVNLYKKLIKQRPKIEIKLNQTEENKLDNKIEEENKNHNNTNTIKEETIFDKIMNCKNFINEIIRHDKYEDIKNKLDNINALYKEYQKDYDYESYENIINVLKELGYNDKKYNSKHWEEYVRKCIDFYNQLISDRNKNEIKLDNEDEIIDNDINEIEDNQIINQIMTNKDFVYLVVGDGEYKEIGEKLNNLNTKYQNYCNSGKSPEHMRSVFRELLTLGYNAKMHGDWEECVEKCMKFKEQLDAAAKKNGIA